MTRKRRTKQLFNCLRCKDKNWVQECNCNICDIIIFRRSKKGRLTRFANRHTSKRGKFNIERFGKRIFINGYWYIYWPTSTNSNKSGYIREHIYFYQEKNKLCMLKWGNVHHIEPVTENYCNNMPWNLQGMMAAKHTSFHNKKDMSDRFCKKCNSNYSYNYNGYEGWYGNDKDGWICKKCKNKLINKKDMIIIYNVIE